MQSVKKSPAIVPKTLIVVLRKDVLATSALPCLAVLARQPKTTNAWRFRDVVRMIASAAVRKDVRATSVLPCLVALVRPSKTINARRFRAAVRLTASAAVHKDVRATSA